MSSILEGPLFTTPIVNGRTLADLVSLEFLAAALGNVVTAILILVVGFWFAGWAKRRVSALGKSHDSLDVTLFDFLATLVRYVIIAYAVLFVLGTFGVQTTSIVAAIGAAGLAVGLALQGTLSNLAAGAMIVFFRPFKQGDFVEVSGHMGTVRAITLNYTELANPSNVQVIIPNSQVWGNVITNYATNKTRRAEWTFGVGYGANLGEAERIIRAVITTDPRCHADPAFFLQVTNLGDSSVDFLARAWCDASDLWAFQTDMTRAVKEALDAGGIDIPFPTRTVFSVSE
ncbi:MAG: mechanosensitive ion channel domain-containing protein [Pseudomonadota bacterium]